MRWRLNIQRAALAAGVLLLAGPVANAGQGAAPAGKLRTDAAAGAESFRDYCSACHGDRGKGNGPAAPSLTPRPSDLTTIAKRKGRFSAADVEATIKGSDTLPPAHGSRAMPVWGPFFTAVDRNDAEAQARITSLVKFIESIQVK